MSFLKSARAAQTDAKFIVDSWVGKTRPFAITGKMLINVINIILEVNDNLITCIEKNLGEHKSAIENLKTDVRQLKEMAIDNKLKIEKIIGFL